MTSCTDRTSETPIIVKILLAFASFLECLCWVNVLGYLPQTLEKFNVPEKRIGFYQGLIYNGQTGAFVIGCSVYGLVTDRFGSKCALAWACVSGAVSCILLAFSTEPVWMIFIRLLIGISNGGIEVSLRVIHQEIRTDAQGLALMIAAPASAGMALAPGIGGLLALPVQQYPSIFGGCHFLDKMPIILPNFLASGLLIITALGVYHYFPKKMSNDDNAILLRTKIKEREQSTTSLTNEIYPLSASESETDRAVVEDHRRSTVSDFSLLLEKNYILASLSLVSFWCGKSSFLTVFSLWLGTSRKYGGMGYSPSQTTNIYLWPGLIAMVFDFVGIGRINSRTGSRRGYAMWALLSGFLFSIVTYAGAINEHALRVVVLNLILTCIRFCTSGILATGVPLLSAASPQKALGFALGTATTVAGSMTVLAGSSIGAIYTWSMGNEQSRYEFALGFPFNHCFTLYLSGILIALGGLCSILVDASVIS